MLRGVAWALSRERVPSDTLARAHGVGRGWSELSEVRGANEANKSVCALRWGNEIWDLLVEQGSLLVARRWKLIIELLRDHDMVLY